MCALVGGVQSRASCRGLVQFGGAVQGFPGLDPREGVIIDHDVIVIFPLGRFY